MKKHIVLIACLAFAAPVFAGGDKHKPKPPETPVSTAPAGYNQDNGNNSADNWKHLGELAIGLCAGKSLVDRIMDGEWRWCWQKKDANKVSFTQPGIPN